MNTKSKITPFPQEQAQAVESPWVLAIVKNKKSILKSILLLVILGVFTGWTFHRFSQAKNKKTSLAYASLDETSGLQSHANLQEVNTIASKYKFMQAHLDGPLSQAFLNNKDISTSTKLNRRIQLRLAPHLDVVAAFNEISLRIVEKKYEEALELCHLLNGNLSEKEMPVLFEYQNLRTALLEKKLHQKNIEKTTPSSGSLLTLGQLSLKDFLIQEKP